MQLPLLHRTTQMAVLKKLIRKKVRELRRRRLRAQRRLEMMRQIRWELLRLMQRLIDLRQRDVEQKRREQARRAVGGMLHMYQRWLSNWTRAIKVQGRHIRQEVLLKRGLNRRLRLLRKRLRKHHRPQHLVDRVIENLAKAVRKWQRRPDHHQYIKNQELIWAQEIEEVRRYLSDIRGKPPKRRKSPRRVQRLSLDLQHFGSFWKTEVLRKKKKLGKIQVPVTRRESAPEWEVYRIPKPTLRTPRRSEDKPVTEIYIDLGDLDADQERRRRRRLTTQNRSEEDLLGPSLKEIQQLFRQLKDHSSGKHTIGKARPYKEPKREAPQADLDPEMKRIHDIPKPQIYRKRHGRNQVNFVLRSLLSTVKEAKKFKWPAMTSFRRKVPIRNKYAKKPKSKLVDEKILKQIHALKAKKKKKRIHKAKKSENYWQRYDPSMISTWDKNAKTPESKIVDAKTRKEADALKKTEKKGRRRKDLEKSKDSVNSSERRQKKVNTRGKISSGGNESSSDDGTDILLNILKTNRPTRETSISEQLFGRNSVASFSDSLNKLIMESHPPRKSVRKTIILRPVGSEAMEPVKKKPKVKKKHPSENMSDDNQPKETVKIPQKTSDQGINKSDHGIIKSDQGINKSELGIKISSKGADQEAARYEEHERTRHVKNNKKEMLPRFGSAYEVEVIPEPRKEDAVNKDSTTSSPFYSKFSLKDLESDDKYKQIQLFLKDVIESNPVLDQVPDVQALMKAVGNHYMWGSLRDLYGELLAGGINKQEIKRLLSNKYVNHLRNIRKAQIAELNKAAEAKAQPFKPNHIQNLRFWQRNRLNSRQFAVGIQGIPTVKGEGKPAQKASRPDTMYKKLIGQEMSAERAKKDKWDERLRRLLPTSETSASMSFASTNTTWEVVSEEEEDLRTIDERYSLTNLNKMLSEHEARFEAMERSNGKALHKKLDSKVKPVEKQKPRTSLKKPVRPLDQMYYQPRMTSREQRVIKFYSEYSEDEQDEALDEGTEDSNSCIDKCPKCGVKVVAPCYGPSPKASSAILSSGSIEACAKNELVVNTIANVCTRCGYVHDEDKPCTQSPEDQRRTVLLRMIK
ncbi:hypothetical protein KR054_009043, partial [Drosophila jambulina]